MEKKRPTREEVSRRTVERLKRFSEHLESGRSINEVYSCRKIILDIEIQDYTPEMVREVRQILKVSQALFAKFLNVSVSLVQKWEQGVHSPEGAACRLMDEIRRDPEHWKVRFRSMVRTVEPADSK